MVDSYFMDGDPSSCFFQICSLEARNVVQWDLNDKLIDLFLLGMRATRKSADLIIMRNILNLTRIGANRDDLRAESLNRTRHRNFIIVASRTVHEISRGTFPITQEKMRKAIRKRSCDIIISGFHFFFFLCYNHFPFRSFFPLFFVVVCHHSSIPFFFGRPKPSEIQPKQLNIGFTLERARRQTERRQRGVKTKKQKKSLIWL